ncbi:MAG: hypothetical protein HUU15_18135 [Candidatus Brocadiae bacterium]|nr:hypothetical protein [Candidatus Brocadiia bacterium]
MRLSAALILLCAVAASAQEIKAGVTEGEWKGGRWVMVAPGAWKKEEGAKFGLWVTVTPPTHQANQYTHVWQGVKMPVPAAALIIDYGIAASDWRPLIEKAVADYGFDGGRTYLVAYSEAASRAVTFVNDHPDFLAGLVLLQPLVQPTVQIKPSGRATPVFLMSDTGCTYARIDAIRSLKSQFEGLGFVATMEEITDPGNPDGWPAKDMARFLTWSLDQRPFRIDDIWDAAAAALAADSKEGEWRPRLRDAVHAWRRQFGDAWSAGSGRAVDAAVASALKDGIPVTREIKGGVKGTVALLDAGKGRKIEGGALVVCASGDFESVEDSFVICSGDLKVQKAARSVFLVRGTLTFVKDATAVAIHTDGRLKAGTVLEDATVLALGGAESAGKARGCVWVNTTDLKLKANEAPKDVTKRRLPGGK